MNQQQFATYNHPSAQQQQQQQMFAAARTNSGYGQAGQFASVGRTSSVSMAGGSGGATMMNGAGPGGLPPIYAWMPPSPQEHQYYDVLFSVADEEQRNAIGGRLAVMFFSRSNADKQILREIWNIADSQQKGELSRNEFYVAMRLISMAQRGEPISVQRFFEFAATPYPLPALEGVPPPPQQQQQPQQMPPMPVGAGGAANGVQVRGGGYGVTDEEKARYDAIFAQYDADNDGFLLGGEAVSLFQMSGLDRNALREIWALADRGQDSKLDVKEFYVAMHLIVCASKRGLPVPPQLPQELIDSAFGASRGSFTSVTGSIPQAQSDFAGASTVGGGAPSPSPAQDSSADSGDPFAGLTPAADAPTPRLGSFTGAQPTTPVSDHQGSFHGASATVQQPTPPGSARGSFYGGAPPTPTADVHSGVGGGFERTSSSSMGSFSSGMSMMAAPSGPSYETPGGMAGVGMSHHVGAAAHNGMMMGGYGGAPLAHMMAAAPPAKPFLSDEDEVQAVRQLEQQNDDVAKALASIEKKQKSIETLAEKLRELDQLRHDLVALAMKRESVRAANNSAASSSSSSAGDNSAELQTKRVVEKSLQDLIVSEKQTVDKLQRDLSGLESELQSSLSSSMTNMSLGTPAPVSQGGGLDFSFAASSPAQVTKTFSSSSSFIAAPAPSSFSALPAAGFDSFGDFGANPASNASTPASAVAFDFPTSSPANSSSSSTFDSFGDFGAKPSLSPMTAATPAAAPSSFDAFAGFDFK